MGCKSSKPSSPDVSLITPAEIVRGETVVESDMVVIEKCIWRTKFCDIPAILKRPKLRPTPAAVKLLRKEAETTRLLAHDRTIRVYGFVSFPDGQVGIVMEEMPMSLEYYLRKLGDAKLSTEFLLKIALQVADSLNCTVQRHVLHNDIALRNVLVDVIEESIIAKICDLGNAITENIPPARYVDDVKAFGGLLLDILKHSMETDRKSNSQNILHQIHELAQRCESSTVSTGPTMAQCFDELCQCYQQLLGKSYSSCNCVQSCLKSLYGRDPVTLVIIGTRDSGAAGLLDRAAIGEVSNVDSALGKYKQVRVKNIFVTSVSIEPKNAASAFKLTKSFQNVKGVIIYVHADIKDTEYQDIARWLELIRKSNLDPKIQILQKDSPTAIRNLPLLTKLNIQQPQSLKLMQVAKISDENDGALWDSFCWLVR